MKFATLSTVLFFHSFLYGQNIIYKQTNKIQEFNYGVVDSFGMEKLSEIEKIKYELKTVSKSYSETIYDNFDSDFEVRIDSNDYEQDWMKLATRFKYNSAGMELYDNSNSWMRTIPYTEEQKNARLENQDDIRENGFHPGLVAFPEFTPDEIDQFRQQNILVSNLPSGEVKIVTPSMSTTYNRNNYTVMSEFIDKNGNRNRQTQGYEPYQEKGGYLLRIDKSERFVYSVNGPCITETKLVYYSDYKIQDQGGLIDKALRIPEKELES
jgi:hypothetical protein